MNFGVSLRKSDGTEYSLSDFSYNNTFNQGIEWNVTIPYEIAINFPDDTVFNLVVNLGGALWTSPPLITQGRTYERSINGGSATTLAGSDYYLYQLSKKRTDFPTFKKQMSNIILPQLSGTVPIVNMPSYYIMEYDAQKGKLIDHISRILKDGGYGFKISMNGIHCIKLDEAVYSGFGVNWVKKIRKTYNTADKITKKKIVKASKIQTHYEFPIADKGFQPVSFQAGLKSVDLDTENICGYIGMVSLYDKLDVATAGLVQNIIFCPDEYQGVNFPAPTSSGPIWSAGIDVLPPKNLTQYTIDVRLIVDGVPDSSDYNGIDLTFEVEESTGETPERPADDYISASIMPTQQHANSIKKALVYDSIKGRNSISFESDDPIPFFEPGEVIPYPGEQPARIERISLNKNGVSLDCVPLPWW